jgi:hypothetical protein
MCLSHACLWNTHPTLTTAWSMVGDAPLPQAGRPLLGLCPTTHSFSLHCLRGRLEPHLVRICVLRTFMFSCLGSLFLGLPALIGP